ncbi:MAG: TetR/AcrR family transcriptional regulator, partial [Desulfovibrionaceae bacterium]|nr:TetR/AcrR family transcriptional regulator [Desulfovibrionaceae bacterium]
MPHEKKRSYHSALRARQASATRMRIISAAEKLFTSLGYTGTTITGIAAQANVAPQTVYAVFGSKKGIISAVVERIHQSPRHKKMHEEALESTDPDTFLQSIAHLIA